MTPTKLKLCTRVDSWWMYCVYRNQADAAYLLLYLFFFLTKFQTLKLSSHFSHELCIVYSLQFSIKTFSSHFSQELCGVQSLNLVHMVTVGWFIMYTGFRLLFLIHPFISSFLFLSNFQTVNCFFTFFSGTVRHRKLKVNTKMKSGSVYRVYWN